MSPRTINTLYKNNRTNKIFSTLQVQELCCAVIHRFRFISFQENKQIWPLAVPHTCPMHQQTRSSSSFAFPSWQPLHIVVRVLLVVTYFLTVLPHTHVAAATIKSVVEARSSVSSGFNAITQFIASFPNNTCDAAGGKRRGVDVDVQRVFVWWVAAVFDDAEVIWVNTIISEAISYLQLQTNRY